jgi:hypothetical protein
MADVIDADFGSVPVEPLRMEAVRVVARQGALRRFGRALLRGALSTHQFPSPPPHELFKDWPGYRD